MSKPSIVLCFVLFFIPLTLGHTLVSLKIRSTDSIGADGIPNVLIIVRSLEGKGEIARGLTDSRGLFEVLNVGPGLYQVISLYPYGYWQPKVQEIVVGNEGVSIELRLKGSIVDDVVTSEKEVTVHVTDSKGASLSGVQIVGRDLEAKFMRFSKTDQDGYATLRLPCQVSQVISIYKSSVRVLDVKLARATQTAVAETVCKLMSPPLTGPHDSIAVQFLSGNSPTN